jgi:ABC-type phosphate/phosphonate transport system substrate-binding protein
MMKLPEDAMTKTLLYWWSSISHCHPPLLAILMIAALLLPASFCRGAWGVEAFHSVVGFSSSTFLDVDRDSAQTVTRLWTKRLAGKSGGTAETRIYGGLSEIERDIRAQKVDVVVLLSVEYLELKNKVPLEPLFVTAKKDGVHDCLVLVVRRDSDIRSVLDLTGRTLVQQKGFYIDGRNMWVDTLLMRSGVWDLEHFFSSIKEVTKPSMAVLPVFFRKADACVVTRSSLQTMGELNPQLQRDLMVIAEAPPRPGSVIALRKGLPPLHREALREILGSLDHDSQGQQLLTIFRMSRLVAFRPEYLTSLEKLCKEHRDLKMRLVRRPQ